MIKDLHRSVRFELCGLKAFWDVGGRRWVGKVMMSVGCSGVVGVGIFLDGWVGGC